MLDETLIKRANTNPTIGPVSAFQYAQYLLNVPDQNTLQNTNVEVSSSEFNTGTNTGAALVPDTSDPNNPKLYFYHPLYNASNPGGGPLTSAHLTQQGQTRLVNALVASAKKTHAAAGIHFDANYHASLYTQMLDPQIGGGVLLIIVGAALIALGVASFLLGSGLPGTIDVLIIKVGIALIIAGTIIEVAGALTGNINSMFQTHTIGSQQGPACPQGGNATCTQVSNIWGCQNICINCDGTSTTTSCSTGPGGDLTGLAWGIGALLVVGVVGYLGIQYVRKHPNALSGAGQSLKSLKTKIVARIPKKK